MFVSEGLRRYSNQNTYRDENAEKAITEHIFSFLIKWKQRQGLRESYLPMN